MKALILAAGFGERLGPITRSIPKSMVEVNGTPLLVNALNNLTSMGIQDIGIAVGGDGGIDGNGGCGIVRAYAQRQTEYQRDTKDQRQNPACHSLFPSFFSLIFLFYHRKG